MYVCVWVCVPEYRSQKKARGGHQIPSGSFAMPDVVVDSAL